eukprot:7141118-Prorocentrum_lima.AAC.1
MEKEGGSERGRAGISYATSLHTGPFSFGYYATVLAESLISEGGNGSKLSISEDSLGLLKNRVISNRKKS